MPKSKKTKTTKKVTSADLLYKTIPPLAAYIERIGAEQLNFRRFMVKEERGKYYIERSIIRINPDSSIACSNPEHEPTAEEAAAIAGALAMVKFPRSILATKAQFKNLQDANPGVVMYPIFNRGKEPGIRMVQARVELESGKQYVPWTMWSDGEWRAMEPDGSLPFFKPEKKRANKIMIHEGAKAAEAAQRIADEGKGHPWADTLNNYEHWGILGGALAPHRADYAELHSAKPVEVVYVCDHDHPGEEALQKVAKYYGKSMIGIKFDERFPSSWDMADPLPQEFFGPDSETGAKIYKGQSLEDYMKPATWATYQIEDEEGKKHVVLADEFAREWYHSIHPEFFIHKRWPLKRLPDREFASLVAPFAHRCDIARLVREQDALKVETIDYRPDYAPGVYMDRDTRIMNVCRPRAYGPLKGDYSILEEYFEKLIADDKDRFELMKWCATLIAKPEVRMTYSVLLVSEQHGTGKSTLGERILAPIIGKENVSFPRERDITGSDFNGWAAQKRLIVVAEIYSGHSSQAYNQLKSIVSDNSIVVNEKYQPSYTVQNWAHVVASSNSMRALKIDPEDRRWLVPKVTEDRQPEKYWVRLNNWLTNQRGYEKIVYWAEEFVKKNGHVSTGVHAPASEGKREVIEAGFSRGMAFIREILARVQQDKEGEDYFVLDTDVIDLMVQSLHGGRVNERIERPHTVRKVAKTLGWHSGGANKGSKDWGLAPFKSKLIGPKKALVDQTPADLARIGLKPVDLKKYLQI